VLHHRLTIYFFLKKKLGPDDGRTQGYLGSVYTGPKFILGPAQPMIQGYFESCSMRGSRIVGSWQAQGPRACWGVPSPQADNPSVTCAKGCAQHRGKSLSVTREEGCPSTTTRAQAPRVIEYLFITPKIIFLILILLIIVKITIFIKQIILFLISRIFRTQIIIFFYIKTLNYCYNNNNIITKIIISLRWILCILRKIIILTMQIIIFLY